MPGFDLGQVLAKVAGLLTIGIGLGVFTETFVEYFIKPIIQLLHGPSDLAKGLIIKYAALVAGFVLAWFANYDLFTPLLGEFGLHPHRLLGPVASAVIVGGGAPFVHAWIEKWRGGKSLRTTGIKSP